MKWIYGILCLGFIVFFHELGHFLAAKLFGVKVESFSLGFGPVIFHKKYGETDYRLSLLPLGGYCGMKGEQDFRKALDAGLNRIDGEPDSMYGIHPGKRALIGFAGPFFNLLFAFLAFTVISMTGYTYYSYPPQITLVDEVYPEVHSAARDAGIKTGDVVTSINKTKVRDFSDIIQIVSSHPDENLTITVNRGGKPLSFTVHSDFDKSQGTGKIGVTVAGTDPVKYESQRYWLFPAVWHGITQTGLYVGLTIKSIGILFKGVDIQNALSGPVRITDMLGDTVKEGFSAGARQGIAGMLDLMAFISISLFIMNLLPVPVLDGGLILFAFIEWAVHKQIHPKIQYYVQYVGLTFIAVLFVISMTSDIHYFSTILRSR
ncbi:MAG: site-2 protease family protein [Treponema sp.]|nr:site-2 protease family protein [Treponema sp.]